MCGIFGYKGKKEALPLLQQGLQRLEYRGYDSAGVCIMDAAGTAEVVKSVGKVHALEEKIQELTKNKKDRYGTFTSGIAHTRWATHGVPSEVNTHPHYDTKKEFFVVHNGIIENRVKLKKQLEEQGYVFYSQTDTEVIPALLARHWTGNLLETVEKVLPMLHGAYALLITSTHTPGEMIGVKRGSPMILGIGSDEFYFSSDMQALAGYVAHTVTLHDGELVHIAKDTYTIVSAGKIVQKTLEKLDTQAMVESKGDHETFMHKEIFEQPAIIARAWKGRVDFAARDIYSNSLEYIKDKDIHRIIFVGCGTSYNAGQVGARRLQDIAGIVDARAEIASEYMHKTIPVDEHTLHVFLSQSGETADSIEVLKHIKAKGGMTLGIVNVVGSSIASMTDCGFFLRAGYEIGVASSKAFTAQLMCIMFLALFLGRKNILSYDTFAQLLAAMKEIPNAMEEVLAHEEDIKKIAHELAAFKHVFFLGRGYQVPVADEGSLKLKEISYIHSESYPAGELKHGPLALVDANFPSVLLAPGDALFDQNMSSLAEVKARSGKVFVVSDKDVPNADWFFRIPTVHSTYTPFVTTMVVQLLAYHVAQHLGRNIDKPRNLAKSVTVK